MNLEAFREEKPWSDSQIIEITKQNASQSLGVCAFDGEQMVGYSRLSWGLCKPGFGRSFINVLPDYRRQGLDSSIFKQIIDHARSIGLSKLICQTHHQSGEKFMTSRGDELADSLSGYAYTFTTPNNTIDRPTKLEGAQRFENLKPGQLATLKFDLGQIDETSPVHLAVFSNGFYDKKNTNPEKNKYAYVGTYLSDENPMLIYIGSWITK